MKAGKALDSLLKHEASKKTSESKNLLDEQIDGNGQSLSAIWVVFGFEKINESKNVKPIKLYISILDCKFYYPDVVEL